MKHSAHTVRDPPASEPMGLPARLLHILFVLCSTSLMLVIAVISFLFVLLFRYIMPAPGPRHSTGRHVTFLEPSVVITPPPSGAVAQRSPAKGTAPSLSLTATPRELEPPTPDVAENPLRALTRICGFLTSNTARAWRGEELAATPPLAGLAMYLAPVQEDLERISEMEGGKAEEEGKAIVVGVDGGSEEAVAAGGSAGAGAGADAHDEPGLVRPDRAATHARPPTPTPPSPIIPPVPNTTSTSIPTPPASEPTAQQHASVTLADTTATTTATITTTTPAPRKRKDAVLRTKRPSIDPSNADALADADDAAVRAAALLSRVADLGAGLFDGSVRERGAALWTTLSRRGAPTDVPVPPLPHTRFAAPTGERS